MKEILPILLLGNLSTQCLIHVKAWQFVNRLIRYSGNIDVYILGSDNKARDHF
jgi:hypothetical protein